MTGGCGHGALLLQLTLDLSQSRRNEQYERASKDAWCSLGLKALDVISQLERRLALVDGTIERRHLKAWEAQRAEWLEATWQAGRGAVDAERWVA